MSGLVDIRRFLVVGHERIDITGCYWCGNEEWICGVCAAKVDETRRNQISKP